MALGGEEGKNEEEEEGATRAVGVKGRGEWDVEMAGPISLLPSPRAIRGEEEEEEADEEEERRSKSPASGRLSGARF